MVDSLEITELLLSRGAEINTGDRDGVTPLALANRLASLRKLSTIIALSAFQHRQKSNSKYPSEGWRLQHGLYCDLS